MFCSNLEFMFREKNQSNVSSVQLFWYWVIFLKIGLPSESSMIYVLMIEKAFAISIGHREDS